MWIRIEYSSVHDGWAAPGKSVAVQWTAMLRVGYGLRKLPSGKFTFLEISQSVSTQTKLAMVSLGSVVPLSDMCRVLGSQDDSTTSA